MEAEQLLADAITEAEGAGMSVRGGGTTDGASTDPTGRVSKLRNEVRMGAIIVRYIRLLSIWVEAVNGPLFGPLPSCFL